MKIYKTNEIKNIALLGSKGSGKTTLAESMVYECGVTKRRGTIEAGNTMSDYFPVEKDGVQRRIQRQEVKFHRLPRLGGLRG